MGIITVVGAGMMGSALSVPASDNGHTVRIVGTHLDREIVEHAKAHNEHINMKRKLPEGNIYYHIEELEQALKGADLVINGVSSFGIDWFIENVMPRIPGEMPVLSVTKGLTVLEDGELITFPELFKRRLPGRKLRVTAVGGPCTSYELADRHNSYVAYCGEDIELLETVKGFMSTDYYHISLSIDVTGVEAAVALKNAYSLAVTMAVGLAEQRSGEGCTPAYNPQAALFAQSVREMRKLLSLMGGGDDNIVYGAGDLYVTIFGGRTRLLGTLLGRGMSFGEAMEQLKGITLESVSIASRMALGLRRQAERGKVSLVDFPLMMHVDDVINRGAKVDIPWKAFTVS